MRRQLLFSMFAVAAKERYLPNGQSGVSFIVFMTLYTEMDEIGGVFQDQKLN